jgi:deazaflavin-dependent oxidoreductase (nitroreductase family)
VYRPPVSSGPGLPARTGRAVRSPPVKVSQDGVVGRTVIRMAASPTFARVAPSIVPRLDRLVHRLTGGRTTMSAGMVPTVLLTTTGSRSGEARTVPLACVPEGEVLYVVGSNYGRERHPAWSTNLMATPRARASFGGRDYDVDAHLLTSAEKEEAWPRLVTAWPAYDIYVERSGRDLRVFRLSPA